jgi:hypothetical protein
MTPSGREEDMGTLGLREAAGARKRRGPLGILF